MKIRDLNLQSIERLDISSPNKVSRTLETARRPIVFTGVSKDFSFLKQWDFKFLSALKTTVPVQKPEADGVNYFIRYERIPMAEVIQRIESGEDLYIGARQITGSKGIYSDYDGLEKLAEEMSIPNWIDTERIHNTNFWLGAGNNNTLLHYDA